MRTTPALIAGGSTNWPRIAGTAAAIALALFAGGRDIRIEAHSGAFDDRGNFEAPPSGVNVTTGGPGTCPCSIWNAAAVPAQADDGDANAVELGTRFRSDGNGYITGVRFYKGDLNTGTHVGRLWSNAGTLLASATFTGETTSGWQQANFASPVSISANTTYVVSYHAPHGHYTSTEALFADSLDNPPLHGLSDGPDGANGVYRYGSGGFPTQTYQSAGYWVDVVFITAPPTSTISSPASGTSFVSGSVVTITGTASDSGAGGMIAGVQVSVDDGATWASADGTTNWTFQWTAGGSGTVTIQSRAFDERGSFETPSSGVNVIIEGSRPCPCSIWNASAKPPEADDGDNYAVELGTRFRADADGYITGVRFYKADLNTGTHVGRLWSNTGALLASVTFTGETTSGWQQANFASPVSISANTTYVVSYHAPDGHYTGTDALFANSLDNPPLHGLRDDFDGPNGVYQYGSGGFPTETYESEAYWVDVVFVTAPPLDTTAPTLLSVFPESGATGVDPAAALRVTFSEAMDPATISASTAGTGTAVPGTFELRDPLNGLVTANVSYDGPSAVATLRPALALAFSTTYTAKVKGGTRGLRVKDLAGNAMAASATWTFTTAAAPPQLCPCSIWNASAAPPQPDDGDAAATEVGTRFRADRKGYITAIRFYKAKLNTGTHVGHLWSNTGALLGSVTFTGETASGWQQATLASPIFVKANTTYVVSYHAPAGHYTGTDGFFAASGLDNPPLHALKDGVDGPNGVYVYGAGGFPNQTYQSEAYWVDVVFNTTSAANPVLYWNDVAMDANAIDHTPPAAGDLRVFGEQLGPARTARAFAIVHIAIFDAVNAIVGGYRSYTGLNQAPYGTSVDAAVALAAHDTLIALYPSQRPRFDALLADDLSRIPDGPAKRDGIELGCRAAEAILALRASDGSDHPEPVVGVDFFPSNKPGKWRPDPISQSPLALGARWRQVTPFVIASVFPFRAPPPPALQSLAYAVAFDEVKALGGDGVTTPTNRTLDQTIAAIYWGYDGTPGLGTPPRLYNQITAQIARQRGASLIELARLFALIHVTMADAALACWETKYYYQFWRPITGIRESDPGTGPTGAGDGNPLTIGDVNFTPLGAPASNTTGPNFTPPFPAYTSGHATIGSSVFQILRHVFGTDDIAFTFVSDEFNGITRDNEGRVRPRTPRSFASLSEAEEENGQSRIYLGIHWAFDKTGGISQGRDVADYVFGNAFGPSGY